MKTRISEVEDKTGTLVKEGDSLSFCYGLPSYDVILEVVVKNDKFFAVAKDNDPLSCNLDELKILVGEFEIIRWLSVEILSCLVFLLEEQ